MGIPILLSLCVCEKSDRSDLVSSFVLAYNHWWDASLGSSMRYLTACDKADTLENVVMN